MSSMDATASDSMRSAEEVPSDREPAVTTEARTADHAGSAAERLGAPSDREQTTEPVRRADRHVRDGDLSDDGVPDGVDTAPRERATLIAPERAESYNGRWNDLKGQFVDEPRAAVRNANELVGEVLDELEELFRGQRADLEHSLDNEQTSTEDLRQAFGRYRSFFDRLLSF